MVLWVLTTFRFRWVELQLNELKKCPTKNAVKKQLANLPHGLEKTYDQILLSIDRQYYPYAKVFLLWLSFAVRPMTLEELAETSTVDLTAENGPWYNSEEKIWDQRDVLKMCSSFVIESKGIVQEGITLKYLLISK